MIKINLRNLYKNKNTNRIAIFFCIFIFIYSVLVTSLVTQKYSLQEGDIAKVDIKAPREIIDEAATKTKIQQALQAVPLQYNKNPEVKTQVLSDINELLNNVYTLKDSAYENDEKVENLRAASKITLEEEDYLSLLSLNKEEIKVIQSFLTGVMSELYDNINISDNKQKSNQEDIKKAQEFINVKVNSSTLPKKILKNLVISIAYKQIKPNFFYNEEKTEELREEIRKKPPIVIKKDQTIVKEGEPVTKTQLDILEKLGLLNTKDSHKWYIYINMGIFVFLILSLQWFYAYKFKNEIYEDNSKIILIGILNCLAVAIARSLNIQPFLIPFAFVPMITTLLLVDRKISLIINGFNCVFISCAVGFNAEITLLAIVNAILGSVILRKMQQRNDILYCSLYIAVINVIFSFSLGLLLSDNIAEVARKAFFTLAGGIISGVLTIGFLPFFESTFDIVTTIKLLELSNPNNPLLKRLLMEAPGTYHHSILVGNLSEVAAEEVGGNPVLARVASYYHDIGKIKRPYFFKENQIGNDNPHNKISANLSTLIITSHIKDGEELAKDYKIPSVIQDIIKQHHGTTLVKYFYLTAKNSSENPDEVNEESFRYPGPKPQTKEAAIIMLADSTEAAVRSISEPTKGKIEEMVNNIVKARLNEGQLDECDLTLKEIEKIKKTFVKVLMGIYHQRIEYPTDKWDNKINGSDKRK
ncbi:putative nucleotidyltransferase with HDIG domain [Clostridium pascui]|uniref:HD family phosphohydrolase n=1 Tax=Clostridium pascui TaxID=46609 RepID=UPI001956D100|nr:HDIG domain-containing metalloprotein [Clostridium pascui]MBM7870228.1 putative nucleotidyltransferase with HDIG domain [Clostridium pascui]